jgi:hypothetical protein
MYHFHSHQHIQLFVIGIVRQSDENKRKEEVLHTITNTID